MLLHERRAGLCGGTVISLIPLIGLDELFRTVVLAIAGATISFLVSYFLKRMLRQAQHDEAKGERGRLRGGAMG